VDEDIDGIFVVMRKSEWFGEGVASFTFDALSRSVFSLSGLLPFGTDWYWLGTE